MISGETAAQRVKFLLGEDGEKLGVETHDVFSELEELFYDEDGKLLEWKETARCVTFPFFKKTYFKKPEGRSRSGYTITKTKQKIQQQHHTQSIVNLCRRALRKLTMIVRFDLLLCLLQQLCKCHPGSNSYIIQNPIVHL